MARRRYKLTPNIQQSIVNFVLAGGYPEVAAESVGIPRRILAQWLQCGEGAGVASIYGAFARAVRKAQAQARLQTEIDVREAKPLDWLKCGPGRETADTPGWTTASKARTPNSAKPDLERIRAEVFALFGECVEQLRAYPEARATLAAWLEEKRRRGRGKNGAV